MNNVNMGGMNAMGGPVGGSVPMMNNGAAGVRPMPQMPVNTDQRAQLNTYIYEYFLRNSMWDCARSLLNSDQPINLIKDSPGRRRDDNGNMGNGAEDGGEDSKDDVNSKQPSDLPEPNLPKECPESCFLYEWWCLFWDMFNAQRGKGDGRNVMQYVTHTQSQSRLRQEQQQAMLRGIRSGGGGDMGQQYQQMMMRGQANGMNLNPNEQLRQKAIQNQQRAGGPQMQMLAQQKQQQMQRDPSDGNNQQRPQSPGSAENAPSPSKRPRLDGTPFNQQQMPNGRGQGGMPQQVGDTGPSNAIQAAHMQLTNGIEPNNLTAQQFPNIPGGQNNGPTAQARLAGYQQNLAQQQNAQMATVKAMPNQGGPANQGSPMMTQGQDSGAIANYYNPGDLGANGMRGPGGVPGTGSGNHALQDYQMQLMLLEQQNKKRLMMARQEQDSMLPRPEGSQGAPGAVGPNGQPFQGTSPQGGRSVNSPNPGEMKRGTPHMNNAGMPSPIPEGQSRGSPGGGMNFNMSGPMDPNMNPQYFKMGGNGMDPNMGGAMPNGMRPPNPHPGAFQNGMTTQQMAMARQQQIQQGAAVQNWTNGPNGQMMPQGAQGAPQQNMGTPQPRSMPPPPSAPATGPATNGRTQPPSPQQNAAPPTPSQTNKANPKKKPESKDSKAKRATKKGSTANLNAGATPSADADTAATPTPATPITPVHPKSFNGQNGVVQPITNGQPAVPATNAGVVSQQPDSLQGGAFNMNDNDFNFNPSMDFSNPSNGMDVLQDFDFDSFLHNDAEGTESFNFDTTFNMDDGGIGAD